MISSSSDKKTSTTAVVDGRAKAERVRAIDGRRGGGESICLRKNHAKRSAVLSHLRTYPLVVHRLVHETPFN